MKSIKRFFTMFCLIAVFPIISGAGCVVLPAAMLGAELIGSSVTSGIEVKNFENTYVAEELKDLGQVKIIGIAPFSNRSYISEMLIANEIATNLANAVNAKVLSPYKFFEQVNISGPINTMTEEDKLELIKEAGNKTGADVAFSGLILQEKESKQWLMFFGGNYRDPPETSSQNDFYRNREGLVEG